MLTDHELEEIQFRGQRPRQYPAETIRGDYTTLLDEVQQLRRTLAVVATVDEASHAEPLTLRASIGELITRWENAGVVDTPRAAELRQHAGLAGEAKQ